MISTLISTDCAAPVCEYHEQHRSECAQRACGGKLLHADEVDERTAYRTRCRDPEVHCRGVQGDEHGSGLVPRDDEAMLLRWGE